MATVILNLQEQAIVISALRIGDPDAFAAAKPSEIIAAAERWEASKIERRDWSILTNAETDDLAWHLNTDRALSRYLTVRS